jgi:hypothetical protein
MKTFASLALLAPLALACGEPSPVIIGSVEDGQIQQALTLAGKEAKHGPRGTIDISVNGDDRTLPLADDGGFAIQDLSSGDLELSLSVEGITGTLIIEDVAPGEVIEIAVSGGPGRISLRVVRRDPPEMRVGSELPNDGSPVRIKAHHIAYALEPGEYTGDFDLEGHEVTLIGAGDCDDPTTLSGSVRIKAHKIRLVNVTLAGPQSLEAHDVRIASSCR